METETIKKIGRLHDEIDTHLTAYVEYQKTQNRDMKTPKLGSESEYSINGVICGIKNILTDISFLCRSHNQFVKISTYSERNTLVSQLTNLRNYLSNKNDSQIVAALDTIKSHLRSYNTRIDKERLVAFSSEIDNLRRLAVELEQDIADVKTKFNETQKIHSEITTQQETCNTTLDEIVNKRDEFIEELNALTDEVSDFKNLAQRAKDNEKTIAEKLEEIGQEKDTFDDFVEKISDREKDLERQAASTENYEKKLEEFSTAHEEKLQEADRLIAEAKKALNYKNAEGLSAAFSTTLQSANKWFNTWIWVVGAIVSLLATLGIGIWIVSGGEANHNADTNKMLFSLVGRLSMIPFTIVAAIFCANQYTKQKNIIDDYAYKTTIAKSIIAFSEELREKDPERYAEYLSTILKEIHQDPLRKRDKDCGNSEYHIDKESAGLINNLISILPSLLKK